MIFCVLTAIDCAPSIDGSSNLSWGAMHWLIYKQTGDGVGADYLRLDSVMCGCGGWSWPTNPYHHPSMWDEFAESFNAHSGITSYLSVEELTTDARYKDRMHQGSWLDIVTTPW